jgi:hypothetical protein
MLTDLTFLRVGDRLQDCPAFVDHSQLGYETAAHTKSNRR